MTQDKHETQGQQKKQPRKVYRSPFKNKRPDGETQAERDQIERLREWHRQRGDSPIDVLM